MPLDDVAKVIAAPFWSELESGRFSPEETAKIRHFRNVYSSLLITGPFSIILGFNNGIMALNDRLKLRSMVAAAIRSMFPARNAPSGRCPRTLTGYGVHAAANR